MRKPGQPWKGSERLRGRLLAVAVLATFGSIAADAETPSLQADPCPAAQPGSAPLTVSSGGLPRSALVHVPPAGNGSKPLPLVVAFHGAGGNGAWIEDYTGLSALSDQQGFIVAYPNAWGNRRMWNLAGPRGRAPDDVAFTEDVIDAIEQRACVDPSRVFATGISNGAGMTARLGCELSDRLRAIAPVAGGYSTLPTCRPGRPLSVLEIHGVRDPVVPYYGRGPTRAGDVLRFVRAWARRDHCPRNVRRGPGPGRTVDRLVWLPCASGTVVEHLRVRDGGHEWPPVASGRIWRFFASFH